MFDLVDGFVVGKIFSSLCLKNHELQEVHTWWEHWLGVGVQHHDVT